MLLRSVFGKTLWERRFSLLWWTIGLVALAAITVAFYPSVREGAETFLQLVERLPRGMLTFFGVEDAAAIVSPVGFINSRLYGSIGAVLMVVFAIGLGTNAIAGEEDRGTMDLLASHPVRRRRIVTEKLAAMVVMTAALALAQFVVLVVADPVVDLGLSMEGMVAANVGVTLLALVFGAFALAVGSLTGRRGFTMGVAAGATVATFFINGLAPLVEEIAWSQKLSPFFWFNGSTPLANGFDPGGFGLMAGVIVALAVLAMWGFERRDIQS